MRYSAIDTEGTFGVVGFFELNSFPGCNQLVVSNHSFIEKEFRGRGFGSKEHGHRLKLIQKLGYDYALCTIKSTNEIQRKILEKHGWKKLDTFHNRETENDVEIWGRNM